ncbi:MAG: DUF2752 domain-containing protein [Chitinophagales bacterium]|nr:DUF2752 domain-containing protein [Chitinophagales bacterium]
MKYRYYFTISKLAFIVLAPVVLLLLPATFFDSGRSLCLSKLFFGFECYACGLSRACMHLIHFDFEEAYAYNMLSFIVLPLLAIIWLQWFIKEWKRYKLYRTAFQSKQL